MKQYVYPINIGYCSLPVPVRPYHVTKAYSLGGSSSSTAPSVSPEALAVEALKKTPETSISQRPEKKCVLRCVESKLGMFCSMCVCVDYLLFEQLV